MAELLIGAVLILLLLRVLTQGDPVDLDELIGLPQLIALVLVIALFAFHFFARPSPSPGDASAGHMSGVMPGLAAAGLLLVLFPERMPDTARGGTVMTAFWSVFGWLMIGLAALVRILA